MSQSLSSMPKRNCLKFNQTVAGLGNNTGTGEVGCRWGDCVNSSDRLSQNLLSLLSEIEYSTWCELTNSGNIRQSSATITTTCPWIIGHFCGSVKLTTREVLGIAKILIEQFVTFQRVGDLPEPQLSSRENAFRFWALVTDQEFSAN